MTTLTTQRKRVVASNPPAALQPTIDAQEELLRLLLLSLGFTEPRDSEKHNACK